MAGLRRLASRTASRMRLRSSSPTSSLPGRSVRAIDRKTGHDLAQTAEQRGPRKVARPAMLFGDAHQLVRQDVQLARQGRRQNRCLGVVQDSGKSGRLTEEPHVGIANGEPTLAIDEQAVEQVQKVVAGGSLDGPIAGQRFVPREDFFDDQVQPSAQALPDRRRLLWRVRPELPDNSADRAIRRRDRFAVP